MKLHFLAGAMIAFLSSGCDPTPEDRQDTLGFSDGDSAGKELHGYADRVVGKMPGGDRVDGSYAGMTVEESAFADLWYFWQGKIVNSGDVAGSFLWLDARRADLEAIGAKGCLRALEALRPHYEKAVSEGREAEWPKGDEAFRRMIESLEEPAFEDEWEELLLSFARAKLGHGRAE
jgi:hypothetical protein